MNAYQNQTVTTHPLSSELSQLQNHLLRFKLLVIQSSTLKGSLCQSQISQRYSLIIDNIQITMTQFCNKYEQELKRLQKRLESPVFPYKPQRQSREDQKYSVVIEKIKQLENSLMRTQLNQNKLIEALNSLMVKHHIYERPSIIQNDQYLRNRIQTSQVSSIITFQPNSQNIRQASIDKSNHSRQNLSKTIKRNQSNIYLFRQNHNQPQSPHPNRQFVRTFSKPNNFTKISLRQVNAGINHQNKYQNPYSQRSSNSNDRRHKSIDSNNEHRLKFLMNKLND